MLLQVSEAKRASFGEDEHTRVESSEMATDEMATFTTILIHIHPILLTRFIRFALASLKMRPISLRSAQHRFRGGCRWLQFRGDIPLRRRNQRDCSDQEEGRQNNLPGEVSEPFVWKTIMQKQLT